MSSNQCPKCGQGMAIFSSRYKKVCYDCKIELKWPLKDKQQPLVKHQRGIEG